MTLIGVAEIQLWLPLCNTATNQNWDLAGIQALGRSVLCDILLLMDWFGCMAIQEFKPNNSSTYWSATSLCLFVLDLLMKSMQSSSVMA